jgi:hypothetical protein
MTDEPSLHSPMNAQELDDVYTQLCHGLTTAGEAATEKILARLVLLLLLQAPSAQAASQAVADALEGMGEPA